MDCFFEHTTGGGSCECWAADRAVIHFQAHNLALPLFAGMGCPVRLESFPLITFVRPRKSGCRFMGHTGLLLLIRFALFLGFRHARNHPQVMR